MQSPDFTISGFQGYFVCVVQTEYFRISGFGKQFVCVLQTKHFRTSGFWEHFVCALQTEFPDIQKSGFRKTPSDFQITTLAFQGISIVKSAAVIYKQTIHHSYFQKADVWKIH